MAVKLSSLKNDLQKEREGDWIPSPEIGPEVEFFVRSTNFPRFLIARQQLDQKLARKFKGDPIPDEEYSKAYGELAVQHLLLDWKGFVDDDEKPIRYTEEIGREILTDPAYRIVRGAIYVAATKVGIGEIEYVENTSKNSAAPSGSNSSRRASGTSGSSI